MLIKIIIQQEHMNLFYDRGKHKWKRNLRNNEKWILGIDLRGEFEMKLRYETEKWFVNEIEIWIWKLMNLRNDIEFRIFIWKLNFKDEF